MDLYSYVGNDPVNKTDPTGLCPMCFGAAIGAGINVATQVAAGMAGGQDFTSAVKGVSIGQVAVAAALGAGGAFGVQMARGAISGSVNLVGASQAIKLTGTADRLASAALGLPAAAATGAAAAELNGKDATGIQTAGLAKIADGLAPIPIGTAVNTIAGNAEKIGQAAQAVSNGVDSAKQSAGAGQVDNARAQKACTGASSGPAMGCH